MENRRTKTKQTLGKRTWRAETCMNSTGGDMYLSSISIDVSQICASGRGEWVTLGCIAAKASNRKPAIKGEVGETYCSRTRPLSIGLSASQGTCNDREEGANW